MNCDTEFPDHNGPERPDYAPSLLEFDPEAMALFHRACYWANVAAVGLISLIVILGVIGHLWVRFGTVFWAWICLNF